MSNLEDMFSIFSAAKAPFRTSLGATKPESIEGAKFPSYSILNKKKILAPPIPSDFVVPKLTQRQTSFFFCDREGQQACRFFFYNHPLNTVILLLLLSLMLQVGNLVSLLQIFCAKTFWFYLKIQQFAKVYCKLRGWKLELYKLIWCSIKKSRW